MKSPKSFYFLIVLSCFFVEAQAEQTEEDNYYKYSYQIDSEAYNSVYDPYEKINRKIFAFNSALDHFILRPIAVGYDRVTNPYIKARVGSFVENINVPLTAVNYGLQLNFDDTMRSVWRFIINTTFGIGGLFDVASKLNLKPTSQTFGSTLARYGVAPGPYLVLPFFGSTNARDMSDPVITNHALNPVKYAMHRDFKLGVTATQIIHDRANLLPFSDYVSKNSVDPYVSVRTAVYQNREAKLNYPRNFKYPDYNKSK